jgi:hypothetical protein
MPLDPHIGAFPGQPQIVEFSLAPEGSGYAYLPAVLGDFFAEKLRAVLDQGIIGVVGRLDYHLQYAHAHFFTPGPPVLTFDIENSANIHLLSRLMWDPSLDTADLMQEWAQGEYGTTDARLLKALERTRAITQATLFVLGIHGPSQLDQISDPEVMRLSLADNFLIRYFPNDPSIRRRTEELTHPTPAVLEAILEEKSRAEQWALQSLAEVEAVAPSLPAGKAEALLKRFRHLVETVRIWRAVDEVFFRWLMWEDAQPSEQPAMAAALQSALERLLTQAMAFEARVGRVYPSYNAARGIPVYEFLLRIAERLGAAAEAEVSEARELWYALVEVCQAKPQLFAGQAVLLLGPDVEWIRLQGRQMQVLWCGDGNRRLISYPLPLMASPCTVAGPGVVRLKAQVSNGKITVGAWRPNC